MSTDISKYSFQEKHGQMVFMPVNGCEVSALKAIKKQFKKNTPFTPYGGAKVAFVAPAYGVGNASATPTDGAIEVVFGSLSIPGNGDHLEKPSVSSFEAGLQVQQSTLSRYLAATEGTQQILEGLVQTYPAFPLQ